MKRILITILVTCLLPLVTLAKMDSRQTEAFLGGYIDAINVELQKMNAQRKKEGKKLYCSSLDIVDESLIYYVLTHIDPVTKSVTYAGMEDTYATDFVQSIADELECYPLFWEDQGRSSLLGVVFNSKAYNMDLKLLIRALENLTGSEYSSYKTLEEMLK